MGVAEEEEVVEVVVVVFISWKPWARMTPTSYRKEAKSLCTGESLSANSAKRGDEAEERRSERDSHFGWRRMDSFHLPVFFFVGLVWFFGVERGWKKKGYI